MTATIMIDGTHAAVTHIPASSVKVAGYVTGSPDIVWTAADWARFPRSSRIRIDQSVTGQHFAAGTAQVLDIETGAATDADAIAAVPERHKRGQYSTIYIQQSRLAALQAELAKTGVPRNRIGYWVADWSLSEAQAAGRLGNEIVAIQFASPSSNPSTVVPGSAATLTAANLDLSVTLPGWYPVPAPPVPPVAWQRQALLDAQSVLKALQEVVTLLEAHQ